MIMAQNAGQEKGHNLSIATQRRGSPFHAQRSLSRREMRMKKTAIIIAAAATFLTSISIAAPVPAASWNWGFSSPLFSYHHDRSVSSRHISGDDSVRVGPFRWSGGFGVGRDHADRCYARYRSYDPVTDTFLSFGGERKRCRL